MVKNNKRNFRKIISILKYVYPEYVEDNLNQETWNTKNKNNSKEMFLITKLTAIICTLYLKRHDTDISL